MTAVLPIPVPLDHTWCPEDRPFPVSYEAALARDPALCVAQDPCSPDGYTTLWTIQPCEALVSTDPPATTVVEVGPPPTLPATGSEFVHDVTFGAVFFVAGIVGLRLSARKAAKR